MEMKPKRTRKSLSKQVMESIEKIILDQKLQPGDALPTEQQISEELGVSKSSVREAIKMLEALGVVEIRRGLCTVISENPEQGYLNVFLSHLYLLSGSAEELREFRKIIEEAYTTQAIATATEADITAIREALEQFRARCRDGTLTVDDDLRFHNQILQATHNAFLISMGTALNALFRDSIGASIRKYPEVALAAVNSGAIEVLMFSINPCYDLQPAGEDVEQLWNEKNYEQPLVNMDPQRQALYETCQRLGVGITVMKAFGGGDLLSETLSPAGKALTLYQCLHYALTRPGVASVMSGARNVEELKTSIAYEQATDEERDYAAAFAALPKISWVGHCMYCGHCAPCPVGIDVASVTKFLNLTKAQGMVPETVREHYAVLPHHAGECVACGACEKRCPFQVPVVENMRQTAQVFGR